MRHRKNSRGIGLSTSDRIERIGRASRAAIESLEVRRLLASITVTTTADDITPNNGSVTLREAITAINAGSDLGDTDIMGENPGTFGTNDAINFSIPGAGVQTINVGIVAGMALPTIAKPVTIDGYTQPGATANTLASGDDAVILVELNGALVTANASAIGLNIVTDNATVRGMAINRFASAGIEILTVGGDTIAGNFLGTDPTGSIARANGAGGVDIAGTVNGSTIGGITPADRNLISGNTNSGVDIESLGVGIASNNIVEGNFIGTDASGSLPLGNTTNGVALTGAASGNTIGGTVAGARNVISGNQQMGVAISGSLGFSPTLDIVEGNFIGIDASGTTALANGSAGVVIQNGANANTIGGTTAGARNTISGNSSDGVLITDTGTSNNTVEGNFVGTDSTGAGPVGNASIGVAIGNNATFNTIGGTSAGAGNLISGNASEGVNLFAAGNSNLVQGNFIGTDVSGEIPVANKNGVVIDRGSSFNTIGGASAAARNIISGNIGAGIALNAAFRNHIEGNYIGTDIAGASALPNSGAGVFISNGSNGDFIGGSIPAAGNTIAFNTGAGISITGVTQTNLIRLNSIYSNGALGIDLGDDGVTANSPGSPHLGKPNDLQSFPILASAVSSAAGITVQGGLNSNANSLFLIDFYSNVALDPSGFGEGQTYVGSTTIITDAAGNALFTATFPVAGLSGQYLSATATLTTFAPFDETSEFAEDIQISAPTPPADLPLAAIGVSSISAVEGKSFAGLIARFSDADPAAVPGDYSVTINWGDSTTSSGSVVADLAGGFDVNGTHIYAEEGTNIPITVSIKDTGGSTATANSIANVADPAVIATGGFALTPVEGQDTGPFTVACFTDPGGPEAVGDYSATVNWGDGTAPDTSATINYLGMGKFTVTGDHVYAEESNSSQPSTNPYKITVVVHHDTAPDSNTVTDTGKVSDPSVIALPTAQITGVEGAATGSIALATFTDPGGPEILGDYAPTINWGDGTATTNGTLSYDAGTRTFTVKGNHTYKEESDPATPSDNPYTITVTIHHETSIPSTVLTTAFITDPAVIGTPVSALSAKKGASTGTVTLANFTDPGGAEAAGDYSATINWGDGSSPANGTIVLSGGKLSVTASHTYNATGTFHPTIVIHHETANDSNTVTDTVNVTATSLTTTGVNTSGNEGRNINATVANFVSGNSSAVIGNFTASINWGDGHTSTGTIVKDSAGHFHVTGTHAYAEESTGSGFTVKTTLTETGGNTVVASSLAKIADSPLDTPAGLSLSKSVNVSFTNLVLGSFRDQDALNTMGTDYTGTITWGDGTTSAAGFVFKNATSNVGSFWSVTGSHKYTTKKTFAVKIVLHDNGSPTKTITINTTIKVS